MENMEAVVLDSKLNLLSAKAQVMLWNHFCEDSYHESEKIYENGRMFFKGILNERTVEGLVRLVSFSEAYSPTDDYVTMEDVGDHKVYGEDRLLASSNKPKELMELRPDLYDEFVEYANDVFFK